MSESASETASWYRWVREDRESFVFLCARGRRLSLYEKKSRDRAREPRLPLHLWSQSSWLGVAWEKEYWNLVPPSALFAVGVAPSQVFSEWISEWNSEWMTRPQTEAVPKFSVGSG